MNTEQENKETQQIDTPIIGAEEVSTTPPAETMANTEATATPVTVWYKNTKLIGAIVLAILILGGAGFYVYKNQYYQGGVVATVNGTKIYRNEYDKNIARMEEGAMQQGANVTDPAIQEQMKKQVLQSLVDNILLISTAKEAGITVTDDEVQAKYDELVKQIGGEDALKKQLESIKLPIEELRSNIRDRVLVDKYFAKVADIKSITASPEEVKAFYQTLLSQNASGTTPLPPFDEIKSQLEQQVINQKQQEAITKIVEDIRSKATIVEKI